MPRVAVVAIVVVACFCCVSAAAFSFGKPQTITRTDPFAQQSSKERDDALARAEAALAASAVKDATVVVGHVGVDEFVVFVKGKGGADVVYEADSSQKWIMATMLLREARRRGVTLEQPLSTWRTLPSGPYGPKPAWVTDEVGQSTLRDFLSFTSGFEDPPACAAIAAGSWKRCLPKLTTSKLTTPRRYFYGTHHFMVALAGLSANDGDDHPSATLMKRFQTETKLLSSTKYDSDKPLSLLITPRDYMGFLRALTTHQLLTADEEAAMLKDQIGDKEIAMSPAKRAEEHGRISGTWHYGLGNWLQCEPGQECGKHHHSAGARGFYPFFDVDTGFYGVVAWNGRVGQWDASHAVYEALKPDLPLLTHPASAR